MESIRVSTIESTFNLKCLSPEKDTDSQRTRITLQQASRSSRTLMRPARHETQVELHCEPPTQVKLLWAQAERPYG